MKPQNRLWWTLALAACAATGSWAGNSAAAQPIAGIYHNPDSTRIMEVSCAVDGTCEGRLLWSEPGRVPEGTTVLRGLKPQKDLYDGQTVWTGEGTLPEHSKTMPVTVTCPDSSTLRLQVQGPLMSHSRNWKRMALPESLKTK